MDDTDRFVALIRAAQGCDLVPAERLAVVATADLLSRTPEFAAAWAKALTDLESSAALAQVEALAVAAFQGESKTVQVMAFAELHAYEGTSGGYCQRYLTNLDTTCGFGSEEPVHRVELLSNRQAHLLKQHSMGYEAAASAGLLELRLVAWSDGSEKATITARGRAWLEAHESGGEPS